MAEEKRLTLHPIPQATQYNRLALYGLCAAGTLILVTYLTVMGSRGNHAQWERPDHFVTYNRPLVTDIPQPPPPQPAPPPQPLPELPPPSTYVPPAPPQPAQPNPDIERRRAALLKAMSAKVLVEGFTVDKAQATQGAAASPEHSRPVSVMPPQWPYEPWEMRLWNGGERAPSLMGRNQQFWQQSSHATTDQFLSATVQPPRSPYQLNAGTIVPAVLVQGITSDIEGTITAQVSNNVYDSVTGRYVLIPQGARLFGVYDADLQANQPRLQLAFKTLYFPNGYSLSLQGMPGADQRGLTGLNDQVNRHFFQRYGTAAVLSLITAGISLATYGHHNHFYSYDPQEAALSGAGEVLGRAVAEDLHRGMNIRPTVTVREAYPFTMTVTQDIAFPSPYPFTQGVME